MISSVVHLGASYSLNIPIRYVDVPYSKSGDSQRSIALFTSERQLIKNVAENRAICYTAVIYH